MRQQALPQPVQPVGSAETLAPRIAPLTAR